MTVRRHRPIVRIFALLSGGLLMAACTGSSEDVRINFCKHLAMAQLDTGEAVEWLDTTQRIQRPEYAVISVETKDGGRASCWFEYDAVDETAETHVDPLSAYATLPYQVSINGQVLSDQETLDAVNAEQRRQGRDAIEQLREAAYR